MQPYGCRKQVIPKKKLLGERGCLNEAREPKAQGKLSKRDRLVIHKNHVSEGNDFISPMK
jgi:hypothetical protein